MPTRSCDRCAACQRGRYRICHAIDFLGIDSPGAMQSIWNVPAELLFSLPATLSLDHAALVDPETTDVASPVSKRTAGAGADVAVEVSGAASGVNTAVDVLTRCGRLVMVAIHPQPRPVNLHRFFQRELELFGARLYQRDDIAEAIRLIDAGAVPAQQLISKTLPADEVDAAFQALEAGGDAMKILLDWRGSG